MKNAALSLGLVGLGMLVVACSGDPAATASFESAPSAVTDKLERMTGSRWVADVAPTTQKASLYLALDGGLPVVSPREPASILAFMDALKDDLGATEGFARELGDAESVSDADEEHLGTVRFRQHVPGTDVPVFDGALTVGVRHDGSLAYIERTGGNRLEGLRTVPAVDAKAAARTAERSVPTGAAVGAPELGVVATNPDAPVLAYRILVTDAAEMPFRVTVDALAGRVIGVEALAAGGTPVQAFAAASGYPSSDKRFAPDKTLPVEVEQDGRLRVKGAAGTIVANDASVLLVPPVRLRSVANGYAENLDDSSALEGGTAVDAAHNLKLAGDYFATQLGYREWAAPTIYVNVHLPAFLVGATTRPNAYFNPISSQLYVDDGVLDASRRAHTYYSPTTSLDFMTHEYAHGVIWRVAQLPSMGESGALNEGLADVFAAHAEALFTNSSAGLFSFASDQRADSRYNRHYLHPTWGVDGGANHVKNMRPAGGAFDQGHVHHNSTLVSHPWALMVWGGYNDTSKLGVTAEIGLPRATALFWETLRSVTGATTIRAFANKMIAYQVGQDPIHPTRTDLRPYWVKHAVVCAWTAVGVFTPEEARAYHAVTCPQSATASPSCAGKRDGVYCDPRPAVDFGSYRCRGGSIAGGEQCARSAFCHRTTGSFDSFAVTDSANGQGKTVCFSEPQTD